jgi:hypothetical protein
MALDLLNMTVMPLEPAPADFTQHAVHAELVLSLVREYLTKMVQDAAENDSSNIIRDTELVRSIDAHLSDLAGDIAGTLNMVAEQLTDDRYGVSTRGPFYRRRSV